MEGSFDLRNRSILSQSYMQGVQRLSGNSNTSDKDDKINEEIIQSREKSWSWLFKKFSTVIPNIGLFNILTLEPDNESNGSEASEVRLPVRKSAAQLQHWINTGDSPWREIEGNDTDEYVSLSESETSDPEASRSLHSTSMIVNQMMATSREHLIATGSSNSSVDTATYIRETGKSGKKKEKDDLGNFDSNRDNNIVGRSINAAIPKALPENVDVAAFDKETRIFVDDGIASDKMITEKTDQFLEIISKNCEIKDSEATFESKESGIGSSGVENTEKEKREKEIKPSSSSEEPIFALKQILPKGRRKLFTNNKNDTILDVLSPMVKTMRRISSVRKSFHPALDTPSTSKKFKTKIGPRLLTMPGRKSRNYSTNKHNRNKPMLSKSRVSISNRHSHGKDTKALDSAGTRISPDNKNPEICHPNDPEKSSRVVSRIEQTSVQKSALNSGRNNKKGNISITKSPGDSSFSLNSDDVSLIINEEWNKTPKKPLEVAQNKNQQLSVENIRGSSNKRNANDQGSIFKQLIDSSSETKESRMRSMSHVKKNLCATDLRSSGEMDSPTTSSYDLLAKDCEDSLSNASTILMPHSRTRNKRSNSSETDFIDRKLPDFTQSKPIVVLHDFLNLKSCCGKLERENKENWLRKEKELETGVDRISPSVNSDERNTVVTRLQKAMDRKVPERKKLKLERKVASSNQQRKTLFTRNGDLNSSEEKILCLRIKRLEDDRDCRFNSGTSNSQVVEQNAKLANGGNSTITFTNTNHNRFKSIFVLSSSDEEDLFKKLNGTSKSRSLGKRRSKDREETEPSTSVTKNMINNDCGGAKSAKTIQDCYKIVSSSSEDETKILKGTAVRTERVAKRYRTRNKRKESTESEQTTSSGEDECGAGSERLQIENEKLEKQSSRVNRRLGRKRGKQAVKPRGDYPVAQRRENNEARTLRKSREERARGNSDKYEAKISLGTKDGVSIHSPEINDERNSPSQIFDNLITPVDRVSNSKKKPARDVSENDSLTVRVISSSIEKSRKTFPRIQRANDSSDSNDRSEVGRVPDYRDRRKSSSTSSENDEGSKKNQEDASSAFTLVLDESSNNDDVLTFQSRNNESDDDSRGETILRENIKQRIRSRKDPASRNKDGNNSKNDARLSSRKKLRHRPVDTKIVFRTKEYWESDSENL